MTTLRIISILCTALLLSGQGGGVAELDADFDMDTIVIEASEHACHVFDVYLALSREQQTRGLMFVRYMPDFTGMLFVYRDKRVLSIWMKNTYIPLDILFIRADGSVANINKNAEPLSLRSMRSIEPLNYVLELNGGITDRLSIDSESRVLLPQL